MAGKAGHLLGSLYSRREDREQYLRRRPSNCPDYSGHFLARGKKRSMSLATSSRTELYSARFLEGRASIQVEGSDAWWRKSSHAELSLAGIRETAVEKSLSGNPAPRSKSTKRCSSSSRGKVRLDATRRGFSLDSHCCKTSSLAHQQLVTRQVSLPRLDDSSAKRRHQSSRRSSREGSEGRLLRAAQAGDLEKVICLLRDGEAGVDACNNAGLTALHLASKHGHCDVIQELLQRGASVDQKTKLGNTALHVASMRGELPAVKLLVDNGSDVNAVSKDFFSPLYMAAQEGHEEVVEHLLERGADPGVCTEDGCTPLAVALQEDKMRVVELLLNKDSGGSKRPPLHVIVRRDDARAASLWLRRGDEEGGTDLNETNEGGLTALHVAALHDSEATARVLLLRGADVNAKTKGGVTPMHVAAKRGHASFCGLLMEHGGRPETPSRDGLTALHCAARWGRVTVAELLLKRCPDGRLMRARTKNALSPLHLAVQGCHLGIIELFCDRGFAVDDVTSENLSGLHIAAHYGHLEVARFLLKRGADFRMKAQNGFTPLHVACKKNREDVAALLLAHGADVTTMTKTGLSPLNIARASGLRGIEQMLMLQREEWNAAKPDNAGFCENKITSIHFATIEDQSHYDVKKAGAMGLLKGMHPSLRDGKKEDEDPTQSSKINCDGIVVSTKGHHDHRRRIRAKPLRRVWPITGLPAAITTFLLLPRIILNLSPHLTTDLALLSKVFQEEEEDYFQKLLLRPKIHPITAMEVENRARTRREGATLVRRTSVSMRRTTEASVVRSLQRALIEAQTLLQIQLENFQPLQRRVKTGGTSAPNVKSD